MVSDDFPAYLQRIDPHDSLSESVESIYVQYRRILLSSASEFVLYDYTCYHFMYGTVLVLYSLVVNTIKDLFCWSCGSHQQKISSVDDNQ